MASELSPGQVEMVLVEGSIQPCVWLARGQRRIVPLSRRVQMLIDRGYVTVLARQSVTLGRRAVSRG